MTILLFWEYKLINLFVSCGRIQIFYPTFDVSFYTSSITTYKIYEFFFILIFSHFI
jgi:hypothetical protein